MAVLTALRVLLGAWLLRSELLGRGAVPLSWKLTLTWKLARC